MSTADGPSLEVLCAFSGSQALNLFLSFALGPLLPRQAVGLGDRSVVEVLRLFCGPHSLWHLEGCDKLFLFWGLGREGGDGTPVTGSEGLEAGRAIP